MCGAVPFLCYTYKDERRTTLCFHRGNSLGIVGCVDCNDYISDFEYAQRKALAQTK